MAVRYHRLFNVAESVPKAFFAYQYTCIAISSLASLVKLIISNADSSRGGAWEHKPVALLYTQTATALLQLAALGFFVLRVFKRVNSPLFFLRSVWTTFESFRKEAGLLAKYWRISRAIDQRFPEITMRYLPEHDPTCTICMEDMEVGRLLPCGHILHEKCLRMWLTRQDRCPLCQHPVMDEHPAHAADSVLERYRGARQQHDILGGLHSTEDVTRLLNRLMELVQQQQQQQQQAPADAAAAAEPQQQAPAPAPAGEASEGQQKDAQADSADQSEPREQDREELRRRRLAALARQSQATAD